MQWVKLHTKILADPTFKDLSRDAQLCFTLSLTASGSDLTDGTVDTADWLMRAWVGREGHLIDPTAIRAELVAAKLWKPSAGTVVTIRSWDRHQLTAAQLEARRAADRTRQARHRSLAEATEAATTAPAPVTGTAAAQAPLFEPLEELVVVPAKEIRARLWAICEEFVPEELTSEQSLAAYRVLYQKTAPEAAVKYKHISGVGDTSMRLVVVNHAATRLLAPKDVLDVHDATRVRLARLHKDYGGAIIGLMTAAGLGASGDPVSYLRALCVAAAKDPQNKNFKRR